MTAESIINWLEGYLDACKNKPSASQIKEIRKKISEYRKSPSFSISGVPNGHEVSYQYTSHTSRRPVSSDSRNSDFPPNIEMLNEEDKRLVELAKNATTMEELHAH